MKANKKGRWAEWMARWLFRLRGYRIVAANYVTGKGTGAGEVDFIAFGHGCLVCVEVKQRSTLENAAFAISERQQKRIWRAAEVFCQKNPVYQDCQIRFDAVLVCLPFRIRHLQNAWNL